MNFSQLHQLNQLPLSLGPKVMTASLSVTMASDQTAIPVSGSFSLANDTNYGVVGANTLRTAAQIGNATGAAAFGTGVRSAQVLRVTISTDDIVPVSQSGTWNINNISGTISLPTGAATSALQTSGNSSLSSIDGKLNSLGQKAMAASVPVVIASDQSAISVSISNDTNYGTVGANTLRSAAQIGNATGAAAFGTGVRSAQVLRVTIATDDVVPVSQSGTWNVNNISGTISGRSAVTHVRNDYSSVNVTTAAYVQLIASTGATINEIEIFDSSGQTLVLAFGAAASEVDQVYITPGGNGRIPLAIPASTRVSIKAVSATANTGEISANFYS